jgi:hypothetical protein
MVKRCLRAALLGAIAALPAAAQVTDLDFKDSPACRINEIPLGQPARIEARSEGARLEVRVATNFGCQTNAGKARVEEAGGEIRLYADTILPGFPTPACKCTRHLEYRFTSTGPGRRIVFYKDGRVEGEGALQAAR